MRRERETVIWYWINSVFYLFVCSFDCSVNNRQCVTHVHTIDMFDFGYWFHAQTNDMEHVSVNKSNPHKKRSYSLRRRWRWRWRRSQQGKSIENEMEISWTNSLVVRILRRKWNERLGRLDAYSRCFPSKWNTIHAMNLSIESWLYNKLWFRIVVFVSLCSSCFRIKRESHYQIVWYCLFFLCV